MTRIRIPKDKAASEDFPPNCMICVDEPATRKYLHKFTYYPSWINALIIFAFLPGLIVYLFLKKQDNVNLHLCDRCSSKFSSDQPLTCLVAIVVIILFIAMIAAFGNEAPLAGSVLLLLMVGIPIAFHMGYHNKWGIVCRLINDEVIELDVPDFRYYRIYSDFIEQHSSVGGLFCRNCGAKNAPGSRFCEKCGKAQS